MLTVPTWRYATAPVDAVPLAPDATHLRRAAHELASVADTSLLANPHHEPQPSAHSRHRARAAAVLIAFVPRHDRLRLVLTRRQAQLRFGGHIALPGGHGDDADSSPVHTALREAEEEIGLERSAVDVIGHLPPYFTHAGHRIIGVLALLADDARITANPAEVADIYEVPASSVFNPDNYRLLKRSRLPYRANYLLETQGLTISGPTLSLLIHVYDALLNTHITASGRP